MASPTAQLRNPVDSPGTTENDRRSGVTVAVAEDADRASIYAIRHQVYALELGQHPPNSTERLSDALDEHNFYLKACVGGRLAGFISITPPGQRYSVDKYFSRDCFPFPFNDYLYELRLLTVLPAYRRMPIASVLMYAALRWIEAHGGERVVAIGRREVLSLYLKAGFQRLGRSTQSGAVTYELLATTIQELRKSAERRQKTFRWLERRVDWRLNVPFHPPGAYNHGGAFFEAIGEDFHDLERHAGVINGDVLDAWFPPAPGVIQALEQYLSWLVRTSPPVGCGGMIHTIAKARGIHEQCIVPAAGSSELIFLAFREWLNRSSRVLLLDPTYSEYSHVTERVIGCKVDRLPLSRKDNYRLSPAALESCLRSTAYDLVVIVNPNSPTGQHVPRGTMENLLAQIPASTRVWIDETYIEYVGSGESLEKFAATSQNVIVCKSMSKVYALSGLRAAYLCASPIIANALREITPPWAVSLPAQVAAVKSLEDPEYYAARCRETHELRESLGGSLRALGLDVVPAVANFLLCHLPENGPNAAMISRRCQQLGLYIRDAGEISSVLGSHALRIAVKDAQTNKAMVDILRRALADSADPLKR